MVGGMFSSLAHIIPLNINQAKSEKHILSEYCCGQKVQVISNWFYEHNNELSVLQWHVVFQIKWLVGVFYEYGGGQNTTDSEPLSTSVLVIKQTM